LEKAVGHSVRLRRNPHGGVSFDQVRQKLHFVQPVHHDSAPPAVIDAGGDIRFVPVLAQGDQADDEAVAMGKIVKARFV